MPGNYGEDTAYWYLRLNGFFPLLNYVLHPLRHGDRQGDIDVLAIRPPFVSEGVGLREPADADADLLNDVPGDSAVGVICEVKTGRPNRRAPFRLDQVAAGVKRLGLLSAADADGAIRILRRRAVATVGNVVVMKLLIAAQRWPVGTYHFVSLDRAEDFIEGRAIRFLQAKVRDRTYFPPGAFQFAIRSAQRHRG